MCAREREGKAELRRGGGIISPVPAKVMPAMNHDSQRCQQEMEKLYLKSRGKKALAKKAEKSKIASGRTYPAQADGTRGGRACEAAAQLQTLPRAQNAPRERPLRSRCPTLASGFLPLTSPACKEHHPAPLAPNSGPKLHFSDPSPPQTQRVLAGMHKVREMRETAFSSPPTSNRTHMQLFRKRAG